jgi:hypothetical protein
MKRIIPFLILAACTESDEAKLDHAQILAVRAEPAHVAPGQRAKIDILAGNDAGDVFEIAPDTLTARGQGGELAVEQTADGWFVTAGATPDLATLSVTLAIDGISWPATKSLIVAEPAANPGITLAIDGNPATQPPAAAFDLTAAAGATSELAVTATGALPFTYAWYSSVGDLSHIHSATATLATDAAGEGVIVVVVRDDVGGVTWQVVPARIQ